MCLRHEKIIEARPHSDRHNIPRHQNPRRNPSPWKPPLSLLHPTLHPLLSSLPISSCTLHVSLSSILPNQHLNPHLFPLLPQKEPTTNLPTPFVPQYRSSLSSQNPSSALRRPIAPHGATYHHQHAKAHSRVSSRLPPHQSSSASRSTHQPHRSAMSRPPTNSKLSPHRSRARGCMRRTRSRRLGIRRPGL